MIPGNAAANGGPGVPAAARPFRADIEGLRALAVLFVFVFHLNESYLPGGYAGVDVFYVISGFVIFRLILAGMSEGRFSIGGFYKRRALRILPALFLTIALCLLAGFVILTPREYEALGLDALAAAVSFSNIHFADRLDYFADAARAIPLLHTWSLGVEEQFYLLAPLFVLGCARLAGRRGLLYGLAAIFALSLTANLLMVHAFGMSEKAFYWPVSRFWEIAAGGLIACAEPHLRIGRRAAPFLALLGLSGMAASALLLDTSTPFPGLAALLPTLSTALVILAAAPEGTAVFRFLSCRIMTFLGRISYSLYLFHWPVIVFTGLCVGRPLTLPENMLLFLMTTALAAASWRFVENPFRKGARVLTWPTARAALAASGLSVCAVAGVTNLANGLPFRMPLPTTTWDTNLQTRLQPESCPAAPYFASIRAARTCAFSGDPEKVEYLLWGDSHAGMIGHQLSSALGEQGLHGIVITMTGCRPLPGVYTSGKKNREACRLLADRIMAFVAERKIGTVILASRWAGVASPVPAPGDGSLSKKLYDRANGVQIRLADALQRAVRAFHEAGAKVVIVGPVPEVGFHVPDMVLRARHLGLDPHGPLRADFDLRQSIVLEALRTIEAKPGVTIIYPHEILCDAAFCHVVREAVPLYRDDDHLSRAGVALILPEIVGAVIAARPKAPVETSAAHRRRASAH